jgi:hypothetical protein
MLTKMKQDLDIYWRTEMNNLYRKGVKIYGVHAYPNLFGRAFYQELARRTGGDYLFFIFFINLASPSLSPSPHLRIEYLLSISRCIFAIESI